MSAHADLERELAELKRRIYEIERAALDHGTDEPLAAGKIQAVICRVEDSRIALPLDMVERATPVAAMAPLPEAPPWVHGLLCVGGEVFPVLDVAGRIERRSREYDLGDQIVICRDADRRIGLLVQEVLGVQTLALDEKTAMQQGMIVRQAPYVRATLSDATGLVLLFSVRRLIATSDIPALDEPPGEGAAPGQEEPQAR